MRNAAREAVQDKAGDALVNGHGPVAVRVSGRRCSPPAAGQPRPRKGEEEAAQPGAEPAIVDVQDEPSTRAEQAMRVCHDGPAGLRSDHHAKGAEKASGVIELAGRHELLRLRGLGGKLGLGPQVRREKKKGVQQRCTPFEPDHLTKLP